MVITPLSLDAAVGVSAVGVDVFVPLKKLSRSQPVKTVDIEISIIALVKAAKMRFLIMFHHLPI
ncbi:MAG: hypothetical protein IKI21_01835, partial [Oscillospiraceae bacterium]|nr:hypothetical protein [Oscillospiraceae bacterium]